MLPLRLTEDVENQGKGALKIPESSPSPTTPKSAGS